jgi:hypothetical protein
MATENNLIMVTENVKEFERISGINIENRIPPKLLSVSDFVELG